MKKTILFLTTLAMISCALSGCFSKKETMPTGDPSMIPAVPAEATASQLEEQIAAILNQRPEEDIRTQEQATAYLRKRFDALNMIGELMLKREDATEEQKDAVREIKLQTIAWEASAWAPQKNFDEDIQKAITEIEAYSSELVKAKSDVQYLAQMFVFELKIQTIIRHAMTGKAGDHATGFRKLFEEARTFLKENEFQPAYAQLPLVFLEVAEMLDNDGSEGLQKFVIAELKPIFEKANAEEAKKVVAMMEGLLRFAELPGSDMEFQCVLLDGKTLDIKDFHGKVVLVDFWATWCGPCRMAIPMMERLYDTYHEKGFELIAYSCDENLDALKEFEERSPHPWPVASVILSVEAGLTDNKTHYGITVFPTFVLVGKDGNVLHVSHNIGEIAGKVTELFADVE